MRSYSAFVLLVATSLTAACPGGSDPEAVVDAGPGGADAASGTDAPSCLPLASIGADTCPPTWSAAMAARSAFCAKEGQQPDFDAFLSNQACRGYLRYSRYLFDGGPRDCIYDPTTLALRGYLASDPKAQFSAITCGSATADFDDRDCPGIQCPAKDPLPACTWPASLDPTDAGNGQCRAARAFVSCDLSNGGIQGCLSNDPAHCPDQQPGTTQTCHDQCGAHEYGIACGAMGVGLTSPPPEGCRNMNATPGGIVFYCCPCGS
jgi:hypothetical protein